MAIYFIEPTRGLLLQGIAEEHHLRAIPRVSRAVADFINESLSASVERTDHHVSQQHLKRYLAEFDFRYNQRSALGVSDAERATKMLQGIMGKPLTYRRTGTGSNI